MSLPNAGSLRDRRRAELRAQILDAAHRLFAERGFAAVTTEDIAATAGVSISTYFRYAPTKESLLVAPIRQAVANVVASYSARPSDESAAEAFINLIVENIVGRTDQHATPWRQAILTAPDLMNKSALISEDDDRHLIQLVAMRMSVDGATDIRPTLLVHTGLATAATVLGRWLNTDPNTNPPLDVQLKQALKLTLAGFD
ncbi:hypothetical protein A5791_07520 [Mycobacterium sp. 852002-51163_SCH5372311]|uniref:TetR family transcriptional regulator n=1 Tax=Mycobacterium sp. 852002-51163_SCH5372311 TaxID=1834097 RepID=UPI000800CE9F|nr:TetR family transcriptional regulator [Mycobacterium sp. 852002-51163_SCH5372311]OBF80788.1 hypothetical protein A5791_07520 [Mycobacterium sp. 852002-51163_SCH5372311]